MTDHYDDKHDRSSNLRARLASVGIFLDDDKPKAAVAARASQPASIDREEIRTILRDLGAPESDLEWLVQSCPSIACALAYRPTIKGTI